MQNLMMINGEPVDTSRLFGSHYVPTVRSEELFGKEMAFETHSPPYLVLWFEDLRKVIVTDPDQIKELLPRI